MNGLSKLECVEPSVFGEKILWIGPERFRIFDVRSGRCNGSRGIWSAREVFTGADTEVNFGLGTRTRV